MTGRLWIVATPIGTLDDITVRALRVLGRADAILAEDTRRTRTLCSHHGIQTPLRSFHAHSGSDRVGKVVGELSEGASLALVTDAGTPVVSDPGSQLVRAAAEAGVVVESVPGPSAVTTALSVAAIRCDTFRFVGFLPRRGGRRRQVFEDIARERGATVLFEAPNRLAATLRELETWIGSEREVAVCRELTKMHEEVRRGPAAELASHFESGVRGEVTVVVGGREHPVQQEAPSEEELEHQVRQWLEQGMSPRDAARQLAEQTPLSKKDAYARVLRLVDS